MCSPGGKRLLEISSRSLAHSTGQPTTAQPHLACSRPSSRRGYCSVSSPVTVRSPRTHSRFGEGQEEAVSRTLNLNCTSLISSVRLPPRFHRRRRNAGLGIEGPKSQQHPLPLRDGISGRSAVSLVSVRRLQGGSEAFTESSLLTTSRKRDEFVMEQR